MVNKNSNTSSRRKRLTFWSAVSGVVLAALLAACGGGAGATATPEMMATESMMATEPMMATATTERMDDGMMATETPEMMDDSMTTETPEMMEDDASMTTETPEMMHDDASMTTETPEMMDDGMMTTETPEMMETEAMGSDDGMMAHWLETAFTDVNSGQSFKISDFSGQVVLVEPFAQWCTTCLAQQKQIETYLKDNMLEKDLVKVNLDIDPNEDATMLKDYLAQHGFSGYYTIAPADTIREIGELYGNAYLTPPSAPLLVIDAHGEVHPLDLGLKSAEDLQKALEPFLNSGM